MPDAFRIGATRRMVVLGTMVKCIEIYGKSHPPPGPSRQAGERKESGFRRNDGPSNSTFPELALWDESLLPREISVNYEPRRVAL
jgi:hypothetical protein